MKKALVFTLCFVTSLGLAFAQEGAPEPLSTAPAAAGSLGGLDGEVVFAPELTDVDTDSAKFNEYRDFDDGAVVQRLLINSGSGSRFLQLRGSAIGRDDQQMSLRVGNAGTWSGTLSWNQLPHRLSRNAFSPYSYAGDGLYTVPGVVGILTSTTSGKYLPSDAATNDQLIAAYLGETLQPLSEIGTQRNRGALEFGYQPTAALDLGFSYVHEEKEGDRASFGTLGDRPPRTLNVEMPEPVDYTQTDLRFQAGFASRAYQLQFEFAAPELKNDVDAVRWESMYFGPDADGSAMYNNDVILAGDTILRRTISTVGQRALAPDNRYPNATLTFGLKTPLSGRLTATAAAGRMENDTTLLPYSYSNLTTDWDSTAKLPRQTADARIDTRLLNLSYSFAPARKLNVRAYARSYQLNNDTRTDMWLYPTQDTAGTTGGVPYKSKRLNLAYGYDRQNIGIETSYRLGHSTVGLELENESMDRDHREANTTEMMVRGRLSTNPFAWLAVRARVGYGSRDGGDYDWKSSSASYWYQQSEVNDGDNPLFGFVNDPDLRRFDVSDRLRRQADFSATITPIEPLSVSATFNWRDDDFDSDVTSIQPLAGTSFAGAHSSTIGIQTGLLANTSNAIGLDANYAPSERWSVNVFATREMVSFDESGSGFDDAEKTNDQEDLIGKPGKSWADPLNRWFATTDDATTTVGIGGRYDIIPDRLSIDGDYAYSRGTVDIEYSGYGANAPLATTYYAFRSPDKSYNKVQSANLGLEYRLRRNLTLGAQYLLEKFDTSDWMLEPSGGWYEQVGSEYFLHDSTRDNRWGNRLPRMGSYLAPEYDANVARFTIAYKW